MIACRCDVELETSKARVQVEARASWHFVMKGLGAQLRVDFKERLSISDLVVNKAKDVRYHFGLDSFIG